MKTISLTVGVILLHLIGALTLQAEVSTQAFAPGAKDLLSDDDTPNAVVLSIHGKCEYSKDGVRFVPLTSKHVFTQNGVARRGVFFSTKAKPQFSLHQGAVIRTGHNSRVDVFFRRIGTTVRLQPDTEVKFEKMYRSTNNDVPVLQTLLDLRKGRIFTVVRSLIEGSTFEIRNAAGRSVMEGAPAGGMGRYIITADGTQVADSSSAVPIRLISDTGITIIAPGQKFDAKEGKTLPIATPEGTLSLIDFDELHALAEEASQP